MPNPVCLCPSSHSHDLFCFWQWTITSWNRNCHLSSFLTSSSCLATYLDFVSLLSYDMSLNTPSCCDVCLLWGTLLCDSHHKRIILREEALDISTETSWRLGESGHWQSFAHFDLDNLIIFIFMDFFFLQNSKVMSWGKHLCTREFTNRISGIVHNNDLAVLV